MESGNKLITAEELEALTQGFVSGTTQKEQPYDPRRGLRPDQDLRALRRINEVSATNIATSLSGRLRTRVVIEPQADEQLTFSALRENLASASMNCVNIIEMPPIGEGLLAVDMPMCFRFIDRYMGGSGRSSVPQRSFFTDIETTTLDDLVQMILTGLQRGWARVAPDISLKLLQRELDPRLLDLWPQTERILISSFSVISDIVTGEMRLCLPYDPAVKLLPKPGSAAFREQVGDNLAIVPALEKRLEKVPLTLSAVLGAAEIPLKELLQLEVGHVIRLDNPITNPVYLQVEGVPKFTARLGRVGKKFALKIEDVLPEIDE